jgi:hypothetical protein
MKLSVLPVEFAGLQGKVDFVRQVAHDEFSSSCPQCGGIPHKSGESPDRFRLFLNAHGKNKVMGWCRRCSYVWFPDSSRSLDPLEFDGWRKEQIEREEARRRSAEKAIAQLKSEKIWHKYNEMLNEWAVDILKSWGIRKDWANYWRLGMFPDFKVFSRENGEYFSPAITIPVWQQDTPVPANIKLRVLNPRSAHDRYRSLYKIGVGKPFVAFNKLHSDTCVLVEGEKKAMVVAQYSDQKYQVVGLPSVTPTADLLANFDKYGTLYLCLDPDAKQEDSKGNSPLKRMVELLNREVRVIDLPDKVDDMIIRGLNFKSAMRDAVEA